MKVYRSAMEKILDKQENDAVITNPKARVATFFRKIRFMIAKRSDKIRRIFQRGKRLSGP
jgi:hypothetical protein